MDKNRLRDTARNNIVTIMFIVLCAVCMAFSGYAPNYVLYELFGRLSRNMFIVLSLIIPIVAMSANAFSDDVLASKKAGMNEHLAKPLELNKLMQVLARFRM